MANNGSEQVRSELVRPDAESLRQGLDTSGLTPSATLTQPEALMDSTQPQPARHSVSVVAD
jgi:hypothetical protein